MKLAELIQHTRCAVLRDEAIPYLWQDVELLRYLNEAHTQFARRTHLLTDDTSTFTTFNTVVAQGVYPLDKRIVFVTDAGIITTNVDSGEKSWGEMRDGTRGQVRRTFSPGRPVRYTAQVGRHTIRLNPVPDAIYEIQMMVARKPLRNMKQPTDVPEIDEDYHLALCDYAAWRALNNNSPEGANMSSGKEFKDTYDVAVRDAKRDVALLRAGGDTQARSNWTGKRRIGRG